jgi:Arc/MetJ family transcription regulator
VYILDNSYTLDAAMRTNIDIDDRLLKEAMRATGQKTKKGAVEAALRKVIEISDQVAALDDLWGMGWEGDLREMRNDWTPNVDWAFQEKPGKP